MKSPKHLCNDVPRSSDSSYGERMFSSEKAERLYSKMLRRLLLVVERMSSAFTVVSGDSLFCGVFRNPGKTDASLWELSQTFTVQMCVFYKHGKADKCILCDFTKRI